MDRDVANVLHCLYWGEPVRRSDLESSKHPYVSCGPDTIDDIDRLPMLQLEDGDYKLLPGYATVLKAIDGQLSGLPEWDYLFGYPIAERPREPGTPRPAFLALPYSDAFSGVKRAVVASANAARFVCDVTGDASLPGNLMEQVWKGIRRAEVVVADITGFNPNVMIEVGFAVSLGKPVLLISQHQEIPFDVGAWRREIYDPKDLADLEIRLKGAFEQLRVRYPMDVPGWQP